MRVLILSGFIILCDQASKLVIKGVEIPWLGISLPGLPYGTSRSLLGNFLRLTYIENPGMAFGIDVGGKLFFSIFSVVASVAIVVYLYHARKEPLGFRLSLAMILGGAVGNLIDRVFYGVVFHEGALFYGKVVDFFDLDFFKIDFLGYHLSRWPVFNIADATVTVGVIMLLFFHRRAGSAKKNMPALATDVIPASGEVAESTPAQTVRSPESRAHGSPCPTNLK